MIPDTIKSGTKSCGTIPHGSAYDLSDPRDEDIGGFRDAGIVWIGLHVECFNWTWEVGKNNGFIDGVDHKPFGG